MANYWTLFWQRLSPQETNVNAEVERLAVLQQAAADRRAEYAEISEQSDAIEKATLKKRMEEAETAHISALQAWENKQSRQKSH